MSGQHSRGQSPQRLPPISRPRYFGKQPAGKDKEKGTGRTQAPRTRETTTVSLPRLQTRTHHQINNTTNNEEDNSDSNKKKEEDSVFLSLHPLGWVTSYRAEQAEAARLVLLARSLFYAAVLRPPTALPVADGPTQLRRLAVRAAVAGQLLESIADALPRHRNTLAPCIALLLREVYVPDTAEIRAALGGTVEYPQLLQDLPHVLQKKDCNGDFAIATNTNTTPTTATDLVAAPGSDTVVDTASLPVLLLSRYARKTYFLAHHELTQAVITLAHANAAQKQHFNRLPRIFALLNASWIKSFLRITLKAWHGVCRERRQREQKYRARWARRFASERIRVAVRLWRVFANTKLQSAAALDTTRACIAALQLSIQNIEREVMTLTATSEELGNELVAVNNHRVEVEARIAEKEQEYELKIAQVREMDRVGTRLLDSLLLRTPFPTINTHHHHTHHQETPQHEWMDTQSPLELLVLWANATLLESPLGPLFIASTDEDFVENINSLDSKYKNQRKLHPGEKVRIRVHDTSEEDLPFSLLLEEATTVLLPLHRLLALMRAMDLEGGPTTAQLKETCIADTRIRALRARFENDAVTAEETDLNTDVVLQLEASVGKTLVEAYESVTGTACLVTANQLMTRRRGIQLVFIAGLMQYYANWLECKVKRQRTTDDTHVNQSATSTIGSSAPVGGDNHIGRRARRCSTWYHPPETHLQWPLMVENQQRWIAASLSALHHAVHVAVESQPVFSTKVQEDTPKFMENITILRLSDILSQETFNSGGIYLRIARTVENVLPKLRSLFLQYAMYGNKNNANMGEKSFSNSSNNNSVNSMHITALDFWRLMRDCRVAGGKGKLHRVAVRRILARVWEDAAPCTANPDSARRSLELTSSMGRPSLRPRLATRETTEIDLKDTHYKIRLGPAEFMEALLRCAHAWDSIQQQVKREEQQRQQGSGNTLADKEGKEESTNAAPGHMSGDSSPRVDLIRYEPFDTTWTLRPLAVHEFLCECIITHGFRGPTLHPFRRAARHVQVRVCLTANLSALYSLFGYYARPKEAYGMRSAAPDTDAYRRRSLFREGRLSQPRRRSDSIFVDDEYGQSHSGSIGGGAFNSSTSNIQSSSSISDVGIARVMTLTGLQHMAAEFEWYRIRRVTPRALVELFSAVAADDLREPHVLFFPEWLDLLCVLALYYDPNPARPLYDKLPVFLEECVLKFHMSDD